MLTLAVTAAQLPVNVFPMLLGLVPQYAAAAERLDQSNPASLDTLTEPFGGDNAISWAQTVTAGLRGPLTKVRLPISCPPGSRVRIEIHALSGTVPSGTPLSSADFTGIATDLTFKDFAFSTTVLFNVGDRFAIVAQELSGADTQMCDWRVGDNSYAGGNAAVKFPDPAAWVGDSDDDFAFETYVDEKPAFTVTSPDDGDDEICESRHCSLREAINAANARPGQDLIQFAITGAGVHTISVGLGGLPALTDQVTVSATTQPGFAGTPLIYLDGARAGVDADGFRVMSANSVIQGFAIGGFAGTDHAAIRLGSNGNFVVGNWIGLNGVGAGAANAEGVIVQGSNNALVLNVISANIGHGVLVLAGTGNRITHSMIGTNVAGTAALGNGKSGVHLTTGNNTVGGALAGERNLISGNQSGVEISGGLGAATNKIQGNYIGTDAAGTESIPNGLGVVSSGNATLIGGTSAGTGNLISGNNSHGVALNAPSQLVQGNRIGTNAAGTSALGNGQVVVGYGVFVLSSDNTIGGSAARAQNVISGNNGSGIVFNDGFEPTANAVYGNLIGTNAIGTEAVPNRDNGVVVQGAANTRIGGTGPGERNVISGNGLNGVVFIKGPSGPAPSGVINGNFIGVGMDGASAVANKLAGIVINMAQSGAPVPTSLEIGSNVIGHNARGIEITRLQGGLVIANNVGTTTTGSAAPMANEGISLHSSDAVQVLSNVVRHSGAGVWIDQSTNTLVKANDIRLNRTHGVLVEGIASVGNTIKVDVAAITNNIGRGIEIEEGANAGVLPPTIDAVNLDGNTLGVNGLAGSGATMDIHADADDEGNFFLGSTTADSGGLFSASLTVNNFVRDGIASGALGVTATQTRALSTSEFAFAPRVATRIFGTARCGATLLPGATVELFSGAALLRTTLADSETAAYIFYGTAPNASYTIHISKLFVTRADTFTISCAVGVSTDARGNGSAGNGVSIPNRKNHTWPAAFTLAPGEAITDYIFREGQSTWFKVPIRPGQRVSVKVTNVPANYSLALYKDIRKLYDQQIAALSGGDPLGAIGNLDASVAPDALSPDELSPDELSPDELSPDALSPDELSPDELSPDELSPDELSPDELSPDALSPDELSPDELSPDELSPDELSPDAYAGAQTAALLGVSAHVGLSPEQIARNTWDNTGFFYMRVRGHNGAFDASLPFTIQTTITDVSCEGATLTEYPVTLTATSDKQTVILTNTSRLAGDTAAFMTKLNTFAARPEVQGAVIDLANPVTLPAVESAYLQWETPAGQACPAAANIVARSVKGVISAYRAMNPGLKYVVIAGNDDVVPFFRQPDQSGLGSEKDYRPAVLELSASQASLRLGYVLTDDFYGSTRPISRFDHELYLPDLAVGRLTETIGEMTTVIDAYISTNGVVAPTRALVAGYDFLSDAANFIADQFAANALTVDRQLIQPVGDSPSDSTAWTAPQLGAKLFGPTTYGILSLNGHFSANTMLAADYATRLQSSDVSGLPSADTRFRNALVLSTGCHSGYNIVNADATALTDPVDWAQAFGSRGATFIGGTGYQYGDTDFMKYTERIHADLTLELRYGTGPVAIGVALANAKRSYISTLATFKGIDEKALAEATLFGLPMLGFNLPAGSRLPLPPTGMVSGLTTATSPGLSYASIAPVYTLNRNARTLDVIGGGTETAIYYDIDGNVAVSPEAPVLPQLTIGVGATGQAVRGAVLMNATYADEQGITPFTDVATTEVRGAHPRYVTEVFTPVRPFDLNHFAGSNLISTPFQFRSTAGGTTGVARRFTSEPGSPMSFRLYYSSLTDLRALAAAPVVYNVTLTPNGENVDVLVTAGALTTVGIENIFVTYTAESGPLYGKWTSLALTRTSTTSNGPGSAFTYAGSIPLGGSPELDVRAIVQAVGGNGLVTWASNDGAYYQVVDETATAADPKHSTSLTLDVPPTGTYLSTVDVTARLMSGGAGLANQPVSFRSGGARVEATTDGGGYARAPLMLDSAPGVATVSVGFAEDLEFLGSGAETSINVLRAPSSFTALDTAPLPVGGSVILATLIGAGEPLGGQLVTLTGGGFTEQTLTDGYGRVRLDTDDGFPSGAYSVTITYDGNDRYLPAAAATVLIVVFDPSTFVTGGGWIMTQTGDTGLVAGKKTNFGVSMKYKSGTTSGPTGNVEFKAKESNVTFKATSLDWLAINGGTAEAQGLGTVNGVAGYSFRVVLVDGSAESFAITIWKDGDTTYALPTYRAGNTLGGGSVQVH